MAKCCECCHEAVYARVTQFAGVHPYCEKHAELEEDFMEEDSYQYWVRLEEEQ